MKKHLQWLRQELDGWVADGLIGKEQAAAIRARYPESGPGLPWGVIIFSSLGGIIIGLGVILLFAYNWHAIPKFGKLVLVATALIAAHAVGIRLFLGGERFRALGEAVCLLGTMLFGAGIWLVAQIYHIQEHFPNAFIVWGLGALVLAWAMPSITHAALAAVLLAVWCGCEGIGFDSPMPTGPLLILLLIAPLAVWQRSRFLLVILIPAFVFSLVITAVAAAPHGEGEVGFAMLLELGALLIAGALLARRSRYFPEAAPILAVFGWGLYLVLLYILTFPSASDDVLRFRPEHWGSYLTYSVAPLIACLATWAMVVHQAVTARRGLAAAPVPLETFLVPLSVVMVLFCLFVSQGDRRLEWSVAGPFNLVFLALAVSMMARGCRQARLRPTVIGSLLLVALVLSRYADLFESLFVRGVLFILIGALIFAEGILYARARRQQKEEASP